MSNLCATVRATALLVVLATAGAASAQDASAETASATHAGTGFGRAFMAPVTLPQFVVDVSPDGRARRSLRFRFDGATRAMRHIGVDADECATLVRSSRRAGAFGESPSLLVSFTLSCRFF